MKAMKAKPLRNAFRRNQSGNILFSHIDAIKLHAPAPMSIPMKSFVSGRPKGTSRERLKGYQL